MHLDAPVVAENCPMLQLTHDVELAEVLIKPALHEEHIDEPDAAEYLPAAQSTQPEDALVPAHLPAEQLEQVEVSSSEL